MLAPMVENMTAEEFLRIYARVEGKYELIDGQVRAMAGGSARHADVVFGLGTSLRTKLRGTACRPFNSDTGLKTSDDTVRYPDLAIYCDPRDLKQDWSETLAFRYPKIIFEVTSPSTLRSDRGTKVAEYKQLDTVLLIVLIDPLTNRVETHERHGPDAWLHRLLPPESDLVLRDPPLTLTHGEIFDA